MKSAETALHDLTLVLIYLTRQANTKNPDDFWKIDSFRAWKSYDWDTVDKLDSEGLVIDKHGNKSLWLTEDGVKRAREILDELGFENWEKNTTGKR